MTNSKKFFESSQTAFFRANFYWLFSNGELNINLIFYNFIIFSLPPIINFNQFESIKKTNNNYNIDNSEVKMKRTNRDFKLIFKEVEGEIIRRELEKVKNNFK